MRLGTDGPTSLKEDEEDEQKDKANDLREEA